MFQKPVSYTPSSTNNERSKTVEPKAVEPKQEPTQENNVESKSPETEIPRQIIIDTLNTAPDVTDPEHPIVDRDPESDAEWDSFNRELQKQNKVCDQKREAKNKGVSLFEIQNQQVIHSNPTEDSSKRCNINKLKSDLILLKSKNSLCSDTDTSCFIKKNKKEAKKQEAQKAFNEALHKCQISQGGTTAEERKQCNDVQKTIRNRLSGGVNSGIESLEDIISKNRTSNTFIPKPTPTPVHGGGI